jgi:hypothetical protein
MRAFHIALPSGSLRVIRPALTSVAAGVGGRGGVTGQLVNTGALGVLGFRDGVFNELAGVYGESDKLGVTGVTVKDAPFATGVFGFSKSGNGIGVRGETVTGVGIQGRAFGSGFGGLFNGNVRVEGTLRR